MPDRGSRERLLVLLSFACVWLVWGSTFLTIRVVIASIPPLLMCALRLLGAGALLGAYGLATGALLPRGVEWRNAALLGLLLPGFGNVSVTLGVAHVPSGLVAVLVSTIPLWMALLASFGPGGAPPGRRAGLGLLLGFVGIALLFGPGLSGAPGERLAPMWALVPVLGSLVWAWGSLWSRRVPLPASGVMSTAVGLLAGGMAQFAYAAATGEVGRWHAAATPWTAWLGLAYLAVFGSALGFGAYLYLLRHVAPASVATYAFVNPVVALALGWGLGGEALSARALLAAGVVLAAVVLITTAPAPRRGAAAPVGVSPMPARRP